MTLNEWIKKVEAEVSGKRVGPSIIYQDNKVLINNYRGNPHGFWALGNLSDYYITDLGKYVSLMKRE